MCARPSIRSRLPGWALLLLALGVAPTTGAEKLLGPEELAALDRENRMWRLVSLEADVPANLQRLGTAGYDAAELARFQPKLEEVWTVAAERNFGWLNPDAVERIQAIDREFITRMRAARMFEAVGIQRETRAVTSAEVNREWRRAILGVLEQDELAEFRLVNSLAAREMSRALEGVALSTSEARRLFELDRDFRAAYGSDPGLGARSRDPQRREAWLDHLAAIRETLGDDRFVVYLGRVDAEFGEMRPTLARIGAEEGRLALDLWRLRQKHAVDRSRPGLGGLAAAEQDAAAQSAVAALLGEDRYRLYVQEDNARWLFSTRRGPREPRREDTLTTSRRADPAGPVAP